MRTCLKTVALLTVLVLATLVGCEYETGKSVAEKKHELRMACIERSETIEELQWCIWAAGLTPGAWINNVFAPHPTPNVME